MATDNDQTPQDLETGDLTSDAGTDNTQQAHGDSEQTPPVDYQKKFSESSKEAQRLAREANETKQQNELLRQQNQMMMNQLQGYYNQPRMSATTQPVNGAQSMDDSEMYGQLADAVLERKPDVIRKVLSQRDQQVEQRVLNTLTGLAQQGQANQRGTVAINKVKAEISDPTSVLALKSMQRYQQLVNDPYYSNIVAPDVAEFNGMRVNPHLLNMAVMETKAQMGDKLKSIKADAERDSESFTEPSSGKKVERKDQFDPKRHLSEAEREYCDKTKRPYKWFWDHIDRPGEPSIRKARLEAGRPLKRSQIA